MRNRHKIKPTFAQKGFSLVEMMIAMTLGLILLLAAGGSFLASQRAAGMAQAMSKNQEASRLAFEMMAKDLRAAGPNPCTSTTLPVNILNSGQTNPWWEQWAQGIRGFEAGVGVPGLAMGGGEGERLASSPVLDVYTADDSLTPLGGQMDSANSTVRVGSGGGRFSAGDIAVICDTTVAFVFQVTGGSANVVQHGAGSGAPGNCSAVFNASDPCTNINDGHRYGWDGQIGLASSYRWYLGPNEEGTVSLWRARMTNSTTGATPSVVSRQEISRGIEAMEIEYMESGGSDYVQASAVGNWRDVSSVRISLTLSQDVGSGVGSESTLTATTSQVISLRNR